MNQENWNQAKEIFYAALQKNTDEREKYLAQACVGDPQLLSDVKTLLASYKSEFLEEPINNFQSENDTEQFSPTSQFQNGDKINHYTIIQTLGKGGMGEVYLAKDNKLERLVAVKVLHKGAGKKAAKRLLREARSAAKLNHPNICSIYEVGETDNFPFIVMQFVEGETLDKLIRRNALTANQSIEFVKQIADALEEAHSHNLAHRDIKPANIIIDSKQQVKVLDFSLAKKVILEADGFSESMLSEFGMVAGTIAYMSPEQARGHEIDSRTDIWSLGVLFYEMLTGTLPFSGDSKSDIIASILTKDPPKLSLTFSNISTEFDEIIKKALQKDKNLRYSSIKEFSANLEQLTQDSHNFTKDSLSEVNDKTTALFRADLVSKDSLQSPTSEINQATYKSEKLSIFQTTSNKINWQWLIPSALIVSIMIGGFYWIFNVNKSASIQGFSAESRNQWQVSTLISMKRKPIGDLSEFKFSPDGKLFSFLILGEETNDIYIKQVDQSEPKKITDGKAINHTPIWSPDGQKIAFVSNRENKNAIWSIPYLGGTPILLTTIEINRINFKLKKWSNDNKRIYFETSGQLKTIELESGRIEDIKLPDIKNTEDFAVSYDEKTIAFAVAEGGNKNIWVHTIGSDKAR
ncbi:MAG: protein kinase [Acidobacteriota bacterium]